MRNWLGRIRRAIFGAGRAEKMGAEIDALRRERKERIAAVRRQSDRLQLLLDGMSDGGGRGGD